LNFQNLPVITGKFFPFTENLLLPVNEILYRTIITRQNQSKRCTEIVATLSVLFLICMHGHNQRPLVPKKGSYKKVITVSFDHSLYKNVVSNIYIICICIYLNLCALQDLYQNASKRDIQPFAQIGHATIHSALTQPLATL
jgi:hypothetical protein